MTIAVFNKKKLKKNNISIFPSKYRNNIYNNNNNNLINYKYFILIKRLNY